MEQSPYFGVYLFWYSLISNPSGSCNPIRDIRTFMIFQIIFSFLFAFSCNIYLAFVSQKSSAYDSARIPQITSSEGDQEIDNKIVQLEEDEAKVNQRPQTTLIRNDGREHKFLEYEKNSYIIFRAFMYFVLYTYAHSRAEVTPP